MNRGCVAMAALLVTLSAGSAAAVTTETWRTAGRERFLAADLESLSVSGEGIVTLAPALVEVKDFDPDYVWCLVPDGNGGAWVGTGSGGDLFRASGDAARLVHDSVALSIESIAVGKDGTIYAGTAPDATILAIRPDGSARTFADLPERHVWGLAFDGSGRLLAATGDRARLYRIDAAGQPEVVYEGHGDHFTGLALLGKDVLLGADRDGLLYAVDAAGKARILMDADEDEVKAIAVAPDGAIFAAVNPAPAGDSDAKGKKPSPVLYRIGTDAVVEPVWTCPDGFIQALAIAPSGAVFAATGGDAGGLWRIDAQARDAALLSRPGPPQLMSLAISGSTLWIGAGSPGKLWHGGIGGSPAGRLRSEVHDAKQVADWGVLRWETAAGDGAGSISVRTRTGNSGEPDETWSDWSAPLTKPGNTITSPAGRFIQWEAEIRRSGNSDSPALREVSVAYLERNRMPQFKEFSISPPGVVFTRGGDNAGPQPVVQNLPGNVRAEFSVSSPSGRGPAADDEAAWARRYRTLRWEAADPNDDPLEYRVEYRGEGETAWRPLAKDLADPLYVFDSSEVADGVYRFRVTASDAPRNPPGEALEAWRESDFVVVDNTPPAISGLTAKRDGGRVHVTARAADLLSPLKLAEISLDGEEWWPVHPVDRIMDELDEEFSVDVPEPTGEPVTVILRVSDQAGNVGIARVAL